VQTTAPPMPPSVADRAGEWPVFALVLLVGLAVGSFLNVCIHRLPADQSVVWPGSRCPACAAPIAWYDNLPVLSWLRLGGRCRACRAPISARYPLVELLTAGLAVLSVARFGLTPWAGVAFAFACALVVVSTIDLDHGIIPDVISLPGILVGLALSALVPGGVGLWDAFAGALLGGGLLWAVAAVYQRAAGIEGLGLGDVKLLAMIGAFLGWQSLPAVLLVASFTGSIGGLALIASRRGRTRACRVLRVLGPGALARHLRRTPLPFGPFLALGALAALYVPALALPWSWVSSG
jgi:leader peptidase (prepilin peptidase) / N-methyltransferase